jgi:hypothetical protein
MLFARARSTSRIVVEAKRVEDAIRILTEAGIWVKAEPKEPKWGVRGRDGKTPTMRVRAHES